MTGSIIAFIIGLTFGAFMGLVLAALIMASQDDRGYHEWLRDRATPCDVCVHNPPSGFGEKPCSFCPAEGWNKEE